MPEENEKLERAKRLKAFKGEAPLECLTVTKETAIEIGAQFFSPPVSEKPYLAKGDMVQVVSTDRRLPMYDSLRKLELLPTGWPHNKHPDATLEEESGRPLVSTTKFSNCTFIGAAALRNIGDHISGNHNRTPLRKVSSDELYEMVKDLQFEVVRVVSLGGVVSTPDGMARVHVTSVRWIPSDGKSYNMAYIRAFNLFSQRLCKVEDMYTPWHLVDSPETHESLLDPTSLLTKETNPNIQI